MASKTVGMRIILIPLCFAVAVVMALALLAMPAAPGGGSAVSTSTQR